eukprot:3557910-Pyramimonas_sp.AAC.1
MDFQQEWDRWSSLLRPPRSRRPRALVRAPRLKLISRFYHAEHCNFVHYPVGAVPGAPALPPDLPGDGPPRPPALDDGDAGGPDGSDEEAGDHDDDDGPAGGGGGAPPGDGPQRDSQEVTLMRQYLQHALQPMEYISVPNNRVGEDEPELFVLQLLSMESRAILVPTFLDKIKEKCIASATVQPMELWRDIWRLKCSDVWVRGRSKIR